MLLPPLIREKRTEHENKRETKTITMNFVIHASSRNTDDFRVSNRQFPIHVIEVTRITKQETALKDYQNTA